MFDSLQQRLTSTFDRLRGRGALTEADVDEAMRDIRTALIEADVALPGGQAVAPKQRTSGGGSTLGILKRESGTVQKTERQRSCGCHMCF